MSMRDLRFMMLAWVGLSAEEGLTKRVIALLIRMPNIT